jgi:hypothetical protein
MSPASWPYSFVVYASDPVQSLVATKGDTGDTGLTGATGATGAFGGVAEFVASGTLPNGTPVILNSDGTVTAVEETATIHAANIPLTSPVQAIGGVVNYIDTKFDPHTSNRLLISYVSGSNGYVVVATISGNTLTFGSSQTISGVSDQTTIMFDTTTANKIIVTWKDKAIVGTISGTSISWGSQQAFGVTTLSWTRSHFDPNLSRFVSCFRAGNTMGAVIGTVSGTSISYGSVTYINVGAIPWFPTVSFAPNLSDTFLVTYAGVGTQGTANVGIISGTSITFGNSYIFSAGTIWWADPCFDPSATSGFVITFKDNGNSGYGVARAGTISGNVITFGTPVVISSVASAFPKISFHPDFPGSFLVVYQNESSYAIYVSTGSLSGTTITIGTSYDLATNMTLGVSSTTIANPAYNSDNSGKFVQIWTQSHGGGGVLNYVVGQAPYQVGVTNLTATNFIGISDAAYADTTTATVTLPSGLSTNQTGLVVGSTYYVRSNGALSTVADNPSVIAGKALSATSILLKSY